MLVCVLHIDLCVKLLAIEVVVEPPVCMQLCGCILACVLDESVGVCSIVGMFVFLAWPQYFLPEVLRCGSYLSTMSSSPLPS